ncbi:hypothetical protein FOA52_004964 [Chlamydomonas sp. UWO 241]|nr:hypothetical protein FOA52_004964 [Chlamydomonas sp. UWO 241]
MLRSLGSGLHAALYAAAARTSQQVALENVAARLTRGLSSAAVSQAYPRGFIEFREYTLKPEGAADFLRLSNEYADVRKELLPLLGIFTCDVGSCLHRVTHMYHYKDFDERDAVRARAGKDARWQEYVRLSRAHVAHQENKVMLEAGPVYEALSLPPTRDSAAPAGSSSSAPGIYEQRTYQLHPGYGSVPKLLEAFRKGLPDKVAADPEGRLVFFGHTDVGTLNNVVELWRYPSAQACINARQAARKVPTWRETIGAVTPGVQHFTSAFLKPLPFSPWQ